jgi:hypothetical protein
MEVRMRVTIAGLIVGLMGIAGCQGDPNETADLRTDPPPRVHQDMYNLSQLDTFPLEVRTAFRRDFPNTGVSSATVQSSETGPLLYKIVYIQNGQAHEVMYDRLGAIVSAPPQPQNPNMTRPGFPAPQPQQAPPPPNPSAAPMTPAPAPAQ